MRDTLAVVPARGGSRQLRRKNLLPDGNGVPLFLVSARAALEAGCTVVVSTDDPEIRSIAQSEGFYLHARGPELADVPVDEVVKAVVAGRESRYDSVLLVQPTVQPMTADLLKWFLKECAENAEQVDISTFGVEETETIRGAEVPVALGVEDRHLIWHNNQVLTERVERNQEASWPVREMGVRWWPTAAVSHPPQSVAVWPHPLVDIDTAQDYGQIAKRLRINFQVRANKQTGAGHLHRVFTLAEGLQQHGITISTTEDTDQWAVDMIRERGWEWARFTDPDVTVLDVLDTDFSRNPRWRESPNVALEDQTGQVTPTINAMYGHGDYVGAGYAVLRQEFLTGDYDVRPDGRSVMVMFGGTDPSNLTDLARSALEPIVVGEWGGKWQEPVDLDIVRPDDDRSIAAAMRQADLLITSGGRTVFEAAAIGVPTLVMCQNLRETTHTHLGVGNLNLGLGRLVEPRHLDTVVRNVLDDYELRRDMSSTARGSIDGMGAARVRAIIEHVGRFGEKP